MKFLVSSDFLQNAWNNNSLHNAKTNTNLHTGVLIRIKV